MARQTQRPGYVKVGILAYAGRTNQSCTLKLPLLIMDSPPKLTLCDGTGHRGLEGRRDGDLPDLEQWSAQREESSVLGHRRCLINYRLPSHHTTSPGWGRAWRIYRALLALLLVVAVLGWRTGEGHRHGEAMDGAKHCYDAAGDRVAMGRPQRPAQPIMTGLRPGRRCSNTRSGTGYLPGRDQPWTRVVHPAHFARAAASSTLN